MKVILLGSNAGAVRHAVEAAGHVVVAETANPEGLVNLILKYEPHFVFINGDEFRFDEIKDAQGVFRSLRLILLDDFEGPRWTKSFARHCGAAGSKNDGIPRNLNNAESSSTLNTRNIARIENSNVPKYRNDSTRTPPANSCD
jgi:hypothetical protein